MVRHATLDDVPAIVELGARFLAETPYGAQLDYQPEPLKTLARVCVESPTATILLEDRLGAVVGMIAMQVMTHPMSGKRLASELAWWVNPDARGCGLRLLREAEQWAREQGAETIQMVAPVATTVGAIYSRLGYTPVETMYQRRIS